MEGKMFPVCGDIRKGEMMNNAIKLIEDILKDMEYIELLLKEGHKYVPPLNTFNLVMKKLDKLKSILENEYLTPEQIMEAVRKLERPIKPDEDIITGAKISNFVNHL